MSILLAEDDEDGVDSWGGVIAADAVGPLELENSWTNRLISAPVVEIFPTDGGGGGEDERLVVTLLRVLLLLIVVEDDLWYRVLVFPVEIVEDDVDMVEA